MQWDKKKDVLCMAFLRRRNCSVADRCSMVFVRKNRWNLQSSQIDFVIVGTFSVCSVISCSFFCIYIDVELFALKAFCFCIFLNSCLKVGNCDGCLKNFKCDAATVFLTSSTTSGALAATVSVAFLTAFTVFSAAGVFSIFSTVDFTVALAFVVALFRLLVALLFLFFSIMEHSLPHISLTERLRRNMYPSTVS